MPISERMLRKWRGEALVLRAKATTSPVANHDTAVIKEDQHRILALTQELLDQALLRREAEK